MKSKLMKDGDYTAAQDFALKKAFGRRGAKTAGQFDRAVTKELIKLGRSNQTVTMTKRRRHHHKLFFDEKKVGELLARNRRHWTADDLKQIVQMYKAGKASRQIAWKLKRSLQAIQKKLIRLREQGALEEVSVGESYPLPIKPPGKLPERKPQKTKEQVVSSSSLPEIAADAQPSRIVKSVLFVYSDGDLLLVDQSDALWDSRLIEATHTLLRSSVIRALP